MPADTISWINNYLKRINFHGKTPVGLRTLINLHEHHVFSVPFENIDIYLKRKIYLKRGDIYAKVVESHRGGFCYELNFIFSELLHELGFDTRIISCRIINDGVAGQEFDHMAVVVSINNTKYLADVGFGELFVQPVILKVQNIQFDGRNFFKVEYGSSAGEFVLHMSDDGSDFKQIYSLNTMERRIEDFVSACDDKQTNPASYFVNNTICTLPTDTGRITLFNDKFTETIDGEKASMEVVGDESIKKCLKEKFQIQI
ncbi:MAG TPA: arylamine N-acetyltransferase [Cyclobacteriaceae bacterium]|nr:arylamine N-acetyltransferase [Cyclobacteriaceae bacterium]